MNKTSTIWIIAAFCAMIIFTALGVITYRLVQKDRTQTANAYEADKQGRIRVAMWRMDTLAASIIQEEDERSVYDFNNPELLPLPDRSLKNQVNNLYYNAPKTTNLYWNIVPQQNSKVISPQVYNSTYLSDNRIDTFQNVLNGPKLKQLENIFSSKNIGSSSQLPANSDFKTLTCAVAQVSLSQWGAVQSRTNESYAQNNDFSYKGQVLSKGAVEEKNKPAQQTLFSSVDKNIREKALSRLKSSRTNAWEGKQLEKQSPKKTDFKKEKSYSKSSKDYKAMSKKGHTPKKITKETKGPEPQKEVVAATPPLPQAPPQIIAKSAVLHNRSYLAEPFTTPFSPVWINKELMLVRKVTETSGDIVQGVWINSEILMQKLLIEIEDLFPDASLIPVQQNIDDFLSGVKPKGDYHTMVKLPLQLKTNEYKKISSNALAYFRGPIGLAWLASFLAVLAIFFMLRSVINMSERRASFVSSVTHELRTPLTTFRLYSDLLATGMVKDEEKQQNYLGTLKHEADRLSHLVDNVLSYSQIERGSAKAKVESITISNLMSRMESRLVERAQEDLMLINIVYSKDNGEQEISVDITAVEQIIFNLVDNACKYASGENYGDQIDIDITSNAKTYTFRVSDEGPGIPAKESKRLFRPFHKSAHEACNTKPGVGLGLALCRRLARALSGDLSICPRAANRNANGACFKLTLPRK